MFQKNVANQPVYLYAFDTVTRDPKTGQSATLTVRLSKDAGSLATVTNSISEVDSTNAKGLYVVLLTQTESNANTLLLVATCSTANVVVEPQVIYTIAAVSEAPTAAAIAGAVCDEALSGHTTAGTVGKAVSDLVTNFATATAVSDLHTDVGTVLTDTNAIHTHVDSIVTSGVTLTAASVDLIWDEALSGHTTAGTAGKAVSDLLTGVNVTNLNGQPVTLATGLAQESTLSTVSGKIDTIDGVVDAIKLKTDTISAAPSAATIADAVLNEVIAEHTTSGTVGDRLNNLTVAAIADGVWDENIAEHTTAGSMGANQTTVASTTNSIKTTTDKVDTALVADGGVYKLTANALEEAPFTADPNTASIKAVTDALAPLIVDGAFTADALANVPTSSDTPQVVIDTATKLDKMIVADGADDFKFDENSLEDAPVGGNAGTGAYDYTIEPIRDVAANPISGVLVRVYSDANCRTLEGSNITDATGTCLFHLNAGEYWAWADKDGYSFNNPDAFTVEVPET